MTLPFFHFTDEVDADASMKDDTQAIEFGCAKTFGIEQCTTLAEFNYDAVVDGARTGLPIYNKTHDHKLDYMHEVIEILSNI